MSGARRAALEVLAAARASRLFVDRLLHEYLEGSDLLSPHPGPPPQGGRGVLLRADRALATELVFGVTRRRRTLDAILHHAINRPLAKVEPALLDLLRLGAYQLVFLTSIPVYAALDETVELARSLGKRQWVGFANGVLRAVSRLVTDAFVESPAADAVPFAEGRYRKLARAVLPDPGPNPLEYVADGFSLPRWLVARWLPRFGFDELCRLGFWFDRPPPIGARVNPLAVDRETLLRHWQEVGVEAVPGEHPQSVRLQSPAVVTELPGYAEGWFTIQDESATWAATRLLDKDKRNAPLALPSPPSGGRGQGEGVGRSGDVRRILDLCSAPGGKTTHLAELTGDAAEIVACDVDAERLARVEEQCRRLRLKSVRTQLIDPDWATRETPVPLARGGPFDAALVDVPCSNTGVLGRRPDARWRIKPKDIEELPELQWKLLMQAASLVRPGGRILYSTCSIEPEENQGVVAAVVAKTTDLNLIEQWELVPGRPADGGFQSLWEKG